MAKKFHKLNGNAIRAAKPGTKITEHGIIFERLPSGDGVYSVNVMVDGQRIHRVIGREADGVTRTQAEDYIAKARTDARNGRLNLPKRRKVALGFREAAGKYLDRLREEAGKDLAMKRRRLELHLVPFFGDTPLSKISSFDVERYKKHRLAEGAKRGKARQTENKKAKPLSYTKPGTVNRELAALSHLFSKATEWEWIPHRPFRLRRLSEGSGRITYLTTDQIEALLDAAQRDENPQIHLFILIGLATTMRRTEILSIERAHIDCDKLTIYIPRAKAGAREQPITPDLAESLQALLAELPKEQVYLFPSTTSALGRTRDIRKAFRRAVSAAGLNPDEIVPHTLRHTAITHLVQEGVDLPTVQRISGHKTLAMVARYSHQNGAHIRAAMQRLANRYRKSA